MVIGMSIWLTRPEYKVLYSNLGPEDASVVIKTLQGDKVAYRITDNGATIMVPQEVVYDQRIKIAGEGGLVGQGIDLRFLTRSRSGRPDFVQKINYSRALQGNWPAPSASFPVLKAPVCTWSSRAAAFLSKSARLSASVVLKLTRANVKIDERNQRHSQYDAHVR